MVRETLLLSHEVQWGPPCFLNSWWSLGAAPRAQSQSQPPGQWFMSKRFDSAWSLTNLTFRRRSNRIYYNYNSDLIINSRWQTHTILDRGYLNQFRHTNTDVYTDIHVKRYPLRLTPNVFASLWVKGWASRSWVPAQTPFSVLNDCPESSNLWIGELQETLSKMLVQPLQPRGAQSASLGTVVGRAASCLALVISQSPSWPQSRSVIFLKISVTIILFHLGYDSGK